MAKHGPDEGWRQHVLGMLPRMEANAVTGPATGFTPATAADFAPTVFYSNRAPDDPTLLLDGLGLPLVKMTSIYQRDLDQYAQIPTYEQVQEQRFKVLGGKNRISELMKPMGEGGPGLSENAPQVGIAFLMGLLMADTSIEWTDATWNPVAGCTVISPGCTNCYAMRIAARLDAMGMKKYRGLTRKSGKRAVWTGKVRLDRNALDIPAGWKKPRRIFVNSMSDLFHEAVPAEFVAAVWRAMQATPQHTYQIL
jgi:hypothetical protein